VRVLTYNIHKWRTTQDLPNVALLADLLKGVEPDVIGLNEVLHPALVEDRVALSWLADELGMYVAFGAHEPRRQLGNSSPAAGGDALLSRFPLVSVGCGLFSPLPGKKQRGFLEARLDLGGGRTATVVTIHLDHTEERARQSQFSDLLAWYGQAGRYPDLILGDCNCVHPREYECRPEALAALSTHPVATHLANGPDGPQLARQIERAGYVDAVLESGPPGRGTFIPARDPVRLDYIWVRSEGTFRLTRAWIVEEPAGQEASDHRPVVAELDFLELPLG
jgi:endonuclease/exonuclease/phosphatase family metal-dependent hydrolase